MGDPMKMTPETRLHVDVEVLADQGQWWPGVIEHLASAEVSGRLGSDTPPASASFDSAGSAWTSCRNIKRQTGSRTDPSALKDY
jgi:hypothetical protein